MNEKTHRSLVHVIARHDKEGYTDHCAWCVIPGWCSDIAVRIPFEAFGSFWDKAMPGAYFAARAPIGMDVGQAPDFFLSHPFELLAQEEQ